MVLLQVLDVWAGARGGVCWLHHVQDVQPEIKVLNGINLQRGVWWAIE